jgi:hypothetical protein
MAIDILIAPKSDAPKLVQELLHNHFSVEKAIADKLYDQKLKPIIDRLIDSAYLLSESNYVDKVYRDSYYTYYSSKLFSYSKNCVRISIFESEIDDKSFRDEATVKDLRDKYLGFFILRPTDPTILGRNLISPRAFKNPKFFCISAHFQTTVNGIKFNIEGFPHSSQDMETITCAETTLWATMEYFGHKYPEYRPVLPSKIIQVLNGLSSERQVPSMGLNIRQMSYALREFGFGTRIYSRGEYGSEFDQLFSCYIESGIPVLTAIADRANGIGHALIGIGREPIDDAKIDSLSQSIISNPKQIAVAKKNAINLLDYAAIDRQYIFSDDNHYAYQSASLTSPALHYQSKWHNCKITFFIAPLYPKIHLEAYQAKNYLLEFLLSGPLPLKNGSKYILRQYLASSRSYKNTLATNKTFDDNVATLILEAPMPKFIWVCELTNQALLKKKQASGLVILDATEANIYYNKPLILGAYDDSVVTLDGQTKKLENKVLAFGPFSIFEGNLKSSTK